MTLKKYLKRRKQTAVAFAAEIGVSSPAVTRWCRGERCPGLLSMRKIERATKGKVKDDDFLDGSQRAA